MKSSLLVGPCPFSCKAPSVFNEVIYVDGGSKHMEQIGTGIIVGDGDSSAPHIKMDIELNPLKDESDLYHALTHAKYQNIQAWGFLGQREDHQLSNLFEAFNFLEDKNNVEINFENRWKVFSRGHWKISHQGVFSLFQLNNEKVKLNGDIKYFLKSESLRAHSSHGISNFSKGEIDLENLSPIAIYLDQT